MRILAMPKLVALIAVGVILLLAVVGFAAWPIVRVMLAAAGEQADVGRIGWDSKTAWSKCEAAIAGTIPWPEDATKACEAMHMCANEATLSAAQHDKLRAAVAKLSGCQEL